MFHVERENQAKGANTATVGDWIIARGWMDRGGAPLSRPSRKHDTVTYTLRVNRTNVPHECSTWNMAELRSALTHGIALCYSPPGGIPGLQHGSHLGAGRGSSSRSIWTFPVEHISIDIDYSSTISAGYVCHGGHRRGQKAGRSPEAGAPTGRGTHQSSSSNGSYLLCHGAARAAPSAIASRPLSCSLMEVKAPLSVDCVAFHCWMVPMWAFRSSG